VAPSPDLYEETSLITIDLRSQLLFARRTAPIRSRKRKVLQIGDFFGCSV
jgi:hypothetical protein